MCLEGRSQSIEQRLKRVAGRTWRVERRWQNIQRKAQSVEGKLNTEQALCSWGHMTKFFLENFYIMGYNLIKNARNGKSASKIPKWPSLRPQEFTSKFIPQFEFSENLEDLYGITSQ